MKLHKYLDEAIDFLWAHRKEYQTQSKYISFLIDRMRFGKKTREIIKRNDANSLVKLAKMELDEESGEVEFDYPTYGGLPKKIANKLDGDFVDAIQEAWPPHVYDRKSQFKSNILDGPIDIKRYLRRD